MRRYRMIVYGEDMGTYEGETQAEALDAYARRAGYASYNNLIFDLVGREEHLCRDEEELQRLVDRVEGDLTIEAIQ